MVLHKINGLFYRCEEKKIIIIKLINHRGSFKEYNDLLPTKSYFSETFLKLASFIHPSVKPSVILINLLWHSRVLYTYTNREVL